MNLKTYESFFNFFKKSQSPLNICKSLAEDLKNKFAYVRNIKIEDFTEKSSKVSYRFIISSINLNNTIQDLFYIKVKKNQKLTCQIKIKREYISKSTSRPDQIKTIQIKDIEKIFNINSKEIEQIVQQIQSETTNLYNELKADTDKNIDELIDSIKEKDKKEQQVKYRNLQDKINKELQFKKERDEYKQSLLKKFDIDNIESLVLDFKDEFHDVTTKVLDFQDKIYFEISAGNYIGKEDPYNIGLGSRITVNDFIKRYKSEYGDDYKIEVNFINNMFYIRFEIGEYTKELQMKPNRPRGPRIL